MEDVFAPLHVADYAFVVGIAESYVNLTNNTKMVAALRDLKADDTPETRAAMNAVLEREIRYLGSADFAYALRSALGKDPGVPFSEIIRDVAKAVKVELTRVGTEREMLEELAERYATQQFAEMTPAQQQQMLVDLGVKKDEAAAFVLKSAGVFSLPLLIQAFDAIIVQGLIKNVIFGTIAKFLGSRIAGRLFTFLAGRMPWWVSWIGPAAWTVSLSWTAFDLQGPASRKTIPIVLYLGLCSLRERHEA